MSEGPFISRRKLAGWRREKPLLKKKEFHEREKSWGGSRNSMRVARRRHLKRKT